MEMFSATCQYTGKENLSLEHLSIVTITASFSFKYTSKIRADLCYTSAVLKA